MVELANSPEKTGQRPSSRRRQFGRRRPHDRPRPQAEEPVISPRLAFIFPGQGSQSVGMGKKLAEAYPNAAEVFSRADEILGFDLSRLCFEGPEEELRRTANAQPALLTCSLAVFRILEESGLNPDILAGHSLGEFTAWVAAGTLQFAEALQLVRKRGELMEAAARQRPGGMLAVLGVQPQPLKKLISRIQEGLLVIANLNCPGQIVVSGEESALRKLRELIPQIEGRAVPLRVSGAFHSPLMDEAARLFKEELRQLRIVPARPPVVCNVSAKPTSSPELVRQAMGEQMTSPVEWEASLNRMAQLGVDTFVEVGPGEVLCGLVKRTLENVRILPAGEPENLQQVLSTLKNIPVASEENPAGTP